MDKLKRFAFEVFLVLFNTYCIGESLYYLLSGIRKPRVFRGYFAFSFAKRYADKRTRKWGPSWNQSGRLQGVMPYTDTTLIVASVLELKLMGKKKLLKAHINPRKLIRKAYYTTKI
jgi:hypothetical protein